MKKSKLVSALIVLPTLLIAAWFGISLSRADHTQELHARTQLEQNLRRAAAACYAAEGVYPPDIAYLEAHYGIVIDRARYTVFYEIFAENLMPEITVVNKQP